MEKKKNPTRLKCSAGSEKEVAGMCMRLSGEAGVSDSVSFRDSVTLCQTKVN